MSATNDGGPAFPIATEHVQSIADREGVTVATVSKNLGTYPGMSLRDWFAGMALGHIPALIDCMDENPSYDNIAEHAYGVADAMIAARERKGGA